MQLNTKKSVIDFGLVCLMHCCWVWLIVPRTGKTTFKAAETVQI